MQEFHVGEDPVVLAEGEGEDAAIAFDKTIEMQDENSTFYCQSLQEREI